MRNILESNMLQIRFDVFLGTEEIKRYENVEANSNFYNYEAALEYALEMITSDFTDFTNAFISLTIFSENDLIDCISVWEGTSEGIAKA